MKWLVFMNFWLEYMHNTARGKRYKMNSSASEIIDDSNWITTTIADMTAMIADYDACVSFHGLKFNKKKCEYMAVNQPDCGGEDDSYRASGYGNSHVAHRGKHQAKGQAGGGHAQVETRACRHPRANWLPRGRLH